MARLAPTLIVVALIAGAGIAFAVTERLKLQRSPISAVYVDKVFSPVCACPKAKALVRFRLRRDDEVTVEILDADDERVRTVADEVKLKGGVLEFRWDGRDDKGQVVPDGVYRPRVELERRSRTFVMRNRIRVDTVRPRFLASTLSPRVFAPDRDGRREYVTARYQVTEPAKVYVVVNGKALVESYLRHPEGTLRWFGRVKKRALPAGRYEVVLVAEDRAGNRRTTRSFQVTVRYVDVLRRRIGVKRLTHFHLRVTTYASTFRWRFGRKEGVARAGALRLLSPSKPGRYVFYATANGRTDTAAVRVRRR